MRDRPCLSSAKSAAHCRRQTALTSISASPTACPVRGYGHAGTQNDRLSGRRCRYRADMKARPSLFELSQNPQHTAGARPPLSNKTKIKEYVIFKCSTTVAAAVAASAYYVLLAGCLAGCLAGWLSGCLAVWLSVCLAVCLSGSQSLAVARFAQWLARSLAP